MVGEDPRRAAFPGRRLEKRPMRFQVQHLIVPLGKAFDAVAYFDRATRAARASAVRTPQPATNNQEP
jgi:hypothetical protein